MAWLSRFLSTLLVVALTSTIIGFVLNQTVLSGQYLENQLTATNSYVRVTSAINKQITSTAGAADPVVSARIKSIVTPEVVQTRLNTAIDQAEAYYRGDGPVPVLDLTDIATKAQTLGVPVSDTSGLTTPITLGPNSRSSQSSPKLSPRNQMLISAIASGVLLVLLSLVCWKRQNFLPLCRVAISVGIFIGLSALVCLLLPGLVDHLIRLRTTSNTFTAVAHDFVVAVAHDIGKRFGSIAINLLVLGIGGHIWLSHNMNRQARTLQRYQSPLSR